MKVLILAGCFIQIAIISFAQHKFGIKIYQNTDIFKTEYLDSQNEISSSVDNVNFTRISLALNTHTKKGYTHELEVFVPEISKSTDDIQYPLNYSFGEYRKPDEKVSSYSFRYELSKMLTKEDVIFRFDLGAAINPYYLFMEYVPSDAMSFYRSTKSYGVAFNIVPRIRYQISPRFTIDLNVPVRSYDWRITKAHIRNPSIPIRHQYATHRGHIFLERAYTIRLGLMYNWK